MKVMITSFGVEHSLSSQASASSLFHRMPPVSFRRINEAFMPDYDLLLLCDSVIMDEASFDRLVMGSVAAYSNVSETFRALNDEGRIELRDFSSALRPHADLLGRMIERDLKLLDQWVEPLRESLTLWRHFSRMSMALMRAEQQDQFRESAILDVRGLSQSSIVMHEAVHMHMAWSADRDVSVLVTEALGSSAKRRSKKYRHALRDVLRAYLTYVNANLILSNQLDVGFHDWLDFTPFYTAKFLSVGRDEDPVAEGMAQLEKLFTIPFPELAILTTGELMKVLNDKRVEDLRRLVAEAVEGQVRFDAEFAKSVLTEVFRSSERVRKARNVVGYSTLPIGFIPWVGTVAQKTIEEGVGIALEKKFKQKHRWFYMLSDIAESTR